MSRRWTYVAVLALLLAGCATSSKETTEPGEQQPLSPQEELIKKAQECQIALRDDPDNVELHYKLGNTLFDLGRFRQASFSYTKVTELDPNHGNAYCNLALSLRLLGDLDGALTAYAKALQIAPDDTVILKNFVAALRLKGDFEGAIKYMRRLAELEPEDVWIRSQLANMLFRMERYEQAIEVFKEVTELDPGLSEDYYNLGLCYYELDNLDAAATTWLTALAYDAENASAHKGLAVLYWRRGDYDRAWSAVSRCETMNISLDGEFLDQLRKDSGRTGPQ